MSGACSVVSKVTGWWPEARRSGDAERHQQPADDRGRDVVAGERTGTRRCEPVAARTARGRRRRGCPRSPALSSDWPPGADSTRKPPVGPCVALTPRRAPDYDAATSVVGGHSNKGHDHAESNPGSRAGTHARAVAARAAGGRVPAGGRPAGVALAAEGSAASGGPAAPAGRRGQHPAARPHDRPGAVPRLHRPRHPAVGPRGLRARPALRLPAPTPASRSCRCTSRWPTSRS